MFREKYYCGLDMGAQRIRAGILKGKGSARAQWELIGIHESKTHGFKETGVSDLNELSECIYSTITQLAKQTGLRLKEVQLGIGGGLVDARPTNTIIPLVDRGAKVISKQDVKKVNEHARLLGIKMEDEILHNLPQYYQIDDTGLTSNPLGLYGRKLGVHSLMIMANVNSIRNITKAVNQAGYDVANLSFNSYVSSEVVLSAEEKQQGCILVDIGSQVTNVLIFKEGVLKYFQKINIGGNAFTESIAEHLQLPFDLAEEIKKSYASVLSSNQYQEEKILVKREGTYIPIKRESIDFSIKAQIKLLVDSISTSLKDSGMSGQVNQGMKMMGGGSLLSGLIERIGQETNSPVELGKINIALPKNSGNINLFAPVAGLAQYGFKTAFGYSVFSNGHSHWAQHITGKIRELYQEYF